MNSTVHVWRVRFCLLPSDACHAGLLRRPGPHAQVGPAPHFIIASLGVAARKKKPAAATLARNSADLLAAARLQRRPPPPLRHPPFAAPPAASVASAVTAPSTGCGPLATSVRRTARPRRPATAPPRGEPATARYRLRLSRLRVTAARRCAAPERRRRGVALQRRRPASGRLAPAASHSRLRPAPLHSTSPVPTALLDGSSGAPTSPSALRTRYALLFPSLFSY